MTSAAEILTIAHSAYERGVASPDWRWLAKRNAFARSVRLSRLALFMGRVENAMSNLTECPICKEWAERHDECAMREAREDRAWRLP